MEQTTERRMRLSKNNHGGLLRSLLTAGILSCLFAMGLLALVAFLLYQNGNPSRFTQLAGYAIAFLTALFFGFFAARSHKKQGIFAGLCAGGILTIVMLILALVCQADIFTFSRFLMQSAVFATAVLGGLIGAKQPSKKRRKRR